MGNDGTTHNVKTFLKNHVSSLCVSNLILNSCNPSGSDFCTVLLAPNFGRSSLSLMLPSLAWHGSEIAFPAEASSTVIIIKP